MEFLYLLIIDRPFTAELCIGTSFRVKVKVEPINNAGSWVGYKLCIAIVWCCTTHKLIREVQLVLFNNHQTDRPFGAGSKKTWQINNPLVVFRKLFTAQGVWCLVSYIMQIQQLLLCILISLRTPQILVIIFSCVIRNLTHLLYSLELGFPSFMVSLLLCLASSSSNEGFSRAQELLSFLWSPY